jgi:type VI secretion system protein ImpH
MKGESLASRIADRAFRFGFFQLTRALEQALQCDATPADSPDAEHITYSQHASLGFPTTDVTSVVATEGAPVEVSFLGLLGTASPLSPEWTEEVLLADEEGALKAFYDLFHHRALSYLYLGFKTHAAEGAFDLEGRDPLSARLRSLAGVDAWAPPDDDALSPMTALGVADYQHGQPQTIDREAAERLLQRTFPDHRLWLETEIRRSIAFTEDERAKLGVRNSKLDGGLVYGARCDDSGGFVRVHVGPVDEPAYESLMPGGPSYIALERLASRIFGGSVDVELEVHVHEGAAPPTVLGGPRGTRLGIDARYEASKTEALSIRVPLVEGEVLPPRTFIAQDEGT